MEREAEMKFEIAPFGMLVCACGAMAYSINHLHGDCTPGKDLCEMRMVHLKDGHERDPAPGDTGTRLRLITVTTSVSALPYGFLSTS
jgi:hypothetical protein